MGAGTEEMHVYRTEDSLMHDCTFTYRGIKILLLKIENNLYLNAFHQSRRII